MAAVGVQHSSAGATGLRVPGTEHAGAARYVAVAAVAEPAGCLALQELRTHPLWMCPVLVLPLAFATRGPAGRLALWPTGCSAALLGAPAAPAAQQVEGLSASATKARALPLRKDLK